jgi:hypothetical protein
MASVKKKSKLNSSSRKRTAKQQATGRKRFVLCISNGDYTASLEIRKVYRSLPDHIAAKENMLRVIDESGEDYLYPAKFFVPISVPKKVLAAFSVRMPR